MVEITGNPVAHLTEYELRHLAQHLEASKQAENLHCLLALETREGHNAWYEARDRLAQTAGYLGDVRRAWRMAEEGFTTRNSQLAIGLQCRYALTTASFNSLATNIPSVLLAMLVQEGLWTPSQGMAVVRQVPSLRQRNKMLIELAPHIPSLLLAKVTEALLPELSIPMIVELVSYLLTPSLQNVLARVCEIDDEEQRAKALSGLASCLPAPLLREALAAALEISEARERAEALSALASELSKLSFPVLYPLWCETLRILGGRTRKQLLTDIGALSPVVDALGGEAVVAETARAIQDVGRWWP